MTLPPNCLPVETATPATGDLTPGLVQPGSVASDTAGATPFAAVLAGATPGQGTLPAPASTTENGAANSPVGTVAVASLPALYSSICYTAALPLPNAETTGAGDTAVDSTADQDQPAQPDDQPATPAEESARLVAYQLIAGQWVPQPVIPPVVPPAQEIAPVIGDAGVAKCEMAQIEGSVCGADRSGRQAKAVAVTETAGKDFVQGVAPGQADGQFSVARAAPLPAADAVPVKTATAKDSASSSVPVADAAVASTSSENSPVNSDADDASAKLLVQPSRLQNTPPEKIAAQTAESGAGNGSGGNSSNQSAEKKSLIVDSKGQRVTGREVGTDVANREYSMSSSAANKSTPPASTALPQSVQTGGIHSGTTAPVPEVNPAAAVQAPRLVQEIRSIADRISTIDRNTVEVRFDFNNTDRLSVRVEYRDGTVHTTFRTDSDSLRQIIAREWHVQAASAEPRAYRVAEPTFSTNSNATSVDLSQSGLGSGQSNGRAFEQRAASGFAGLVHNSRTASGAASGEVGKPVVTLRPETALHLHTFA